MTGSGEVLLEVDGGVAVVTLNAPDRRNANNLTSQRVADLGGGATFYDCRVEVERVDDVRA